ncbi:hypothetical protein BJ508DRAFT_303400 [Ascobolus immersus RN42]|uniref:Secreted protein n=1 Tax=Ascobolus immersus RN42 TaxID=1160509 RepID=A0A3N4IFS1_ASCIM|nr:hypothetical protein BJ508DRAFT_303400 [Ascobolus immersus RN42]
MHLSSFLPSGIALSKTAVLLIAIASVSSARPGPPVLERRDNQHVFQLVNKGTEQPCTGWFSTNVLQTAGFTAVKFSDSDPEAGYNDGSNFRKDILQPNFDKAKSGILKHCRLQKINFSLAGDLRESRAASYEKWMNSAAGGNKDNTLYVELICKPRSTASLDTFDMAEFLDYSRARETNRAGETIEECPDFDLNMCVKSEMEAFAKHRLLICPPDQKYRDDRGLGDPNPKRLYFNGSGCWYRNLVFLDLIQRTCGDKNNRFWGEERFEKGAKAEGILRVGTWTMNRSGKRELVWAYDIQVREPRQE